MFCLRSCSPHPATPHIYTLSLHDALPIFLRQIGAGPARLPVQIRVGLPQSPIDVHPELRGDGTDDVHRSFDLEVITDRSEEHTSELQSRVDLVCRLLLEKKKKEQKTKYDI